ncbi:MAG: hypothetical protein ACI4O4_11970 [Candidatus Ventricola sp.]|nr:hypothetical protein [Eubacteriales bacterium]
MQSRISSNALVRSVICNAALGVAEESARRHQPSFTFMGAVFHFNWVNAQDAYVTCRGAHAGIRIYDGVAVLD